MCLDNMAGSDIYCVEISALNFAVPAFFCAGPRQPLATGVQNPACVLSHSTVSDNLKTSIDTRLPDLSGRKGSLESE